jgi:hypothetical protein
LGHCFEITRRFFIEQRSCTVLGTCDAPMTLLTGAVDLHFVQVAALATPAVSDSLN